MPSDPRRLLATVALLMTLSAPTKAWMEEILQPSAPVMNAPPVVAEPPAGEVMELTLAKAVALGLQGNRTIRSAYLQRISQRFDLKVAEEQFDPQFNVQGRYIVTQRDDDREQLNEVSPTVSMEGPLGTHFSLSWMEALNRSGEVGSRHSRGVTFTVIQPLLRDAGRDVATAPLRLARLSEQMNQLELQSTVSQVVTQIVLAYRELLRAQEQVRIAGDGLARSRQLAEVNEALIAAGQMAEFDIVQTQADMASRELDVEEAINQRESRRLELLHLLALDLATPLRASEPLTAQQVSLDAEEARRIAKAHQPEYLTQLIAREQVETHAAVAHNQRLWDISLVGGASQLQDRFGRSEYPSDRRWNAYAGVQVEIPIGNAGLRRDEVQARVNIYDQALRLAETEQTLARDIDDAVRSLEAQWRQFQLAQRAAELSQRALELEREKLSVGRSSNFQVLSQETELRNAQHARLKALIAYLNAQTQLDLRLGMTLESWDIALNDD
ncbi:TolC family protein [Halomonas faecis]|uniref:TolC family protein n=1 Tax=Halomonas faecis TaxID=1562110 RepID=UPI00196A1356|nr:TolC family protein [Halomonas faecis]